MLSFKKFKYVCQLLPASSCSPRHLWQRQWFSFLIHHFHYLHHPPLFYSLSFTLTNHQHNTKCVAYAKALHINEKYIRPHKKHIQLQQQKIKETKKRKELMTWSTFFIFEKALFCSFPCRSITENVDEAAVFQVLPFLFCFESFRLSAAHCCLLYGCVYVRWCECIRVKNFMTLECCA